VCDIEQLVVTGKQMKACPYYGTRYAIPSAQVNRLFHSVHHDAGIPDNCRLHVGQVVCYSW